MSVSEVPAKPAVLRGAIRGGSAPGMACAI